MVEPTPAASVLDALPVAVALVDGEGVIRHVNPAAVARYGWVTAADVVGRPASELGDGIADRLPLGRWKGELPATRADGSTFVGLFEISELPGEGTLVTCLERVTGGDSERLAERIARLQALTAKLSTARTVDEVAAVVCDHGAAGLGATSGAFLQLADDGALEVVRHQGYRPGALDRYRRIDVDAALPAGEAVRTRAMVLLTDSGDRDERFPLLTGEPATHQALAVVPLLFGDQPMGVVSFGFRSPRRFGDDDRRFLLALAAQAAQALERARLDEADRLARRRQEFLSRASGVLASSFDHESTVRALARLSVPELADAFTVHLLHGSELRPVVAVHADARLEDEMVELALDGTGRAMAGYLARLVDGGRSVLEPHVPERWWSSFARGERDEERIASLDISSSIVAGLHAGGRLLGVLAVGRGGGRPPFTEDDHVLVSDIAARMAATVDNALAHHARGEVARTLQASLLPPKLPDVPGLAIAARYDPVGDGSLVGGDFYDVFPLGGDQWGFVLGDVCGQGVQAAALTSLVRYTVRAAARIWLSPAEILRFTNQAILDQDTGERFCTVVVGVLRTGGDVTTVTLASAGHHSPIHVSPDGRGRPVGQPGIALGLVADPRVEETSIRLEEGDLLLLYTDGVVEARDPSGVTVPPDFLDDLVAANAGQGADALASAIEQAVLQVGGGRALDDVAVLVLGPVTTDLRPAAERADEPFDERYQPAAASVTASRRAVGDWLARQGLDDMRRHDLLLAVTELTTNAVRTTRTAIEVRCWRTPEGLVAEVTDDGPGFDPSVPRDSRELDPLAERGRGLFLVAALVDECTIESGPNGTIVRCFVNRS